MYSAHTCLWRGACEREKSRKQPPLEWNLIHIYFPHSPFGNMWPYLFAWMNKSRNLSINIRHGSTPGLLSSPLFLICPKPPTPKPPQPKPLQLSDFLRLSVFCARNFTQTREGMCGYRFTTFHIYLNLFKLRVSKKCPWL